jgi:putative ABC transport system permease protein
MRALVLAGAAELRRHPLETALVALLLACAAGTLALALALGTSASRPFDRAFAAAGKPHVTIETETDARALRALRSRAAVAATGPTPQLLGTVEPRADDVRTATLRAAPAVLPAVDRPLVSRGRWVSGPGEAVVERSFAQALGVSPGATLIVAARGRPAQRMRVVGTAVSVGRGAYPDRMPGLAWIARAALAKLTAPGVTEQHYLALRLADPHAARDVVKHARELGPDVRAFDWEQLRETAVDAERTDTAALGALSAFALIAVGLILANVVAARVIARRRDLAVLRSLGATPRQVTLLLIAQHTALALPAGAAAAAAGLLLGAPLRQRAAEAFASPAPNPTAPALLAVALVVVAAAAFSLPAALRARSITPLAALRGAPAERTPRRSLLAATAELLRLPVPIVTAIEDTVARRGRGALTVLSLALTVATGVIALGMEATYRHILRDTAIDGVPYQVRLIPGALGEPRSRALLARHRAQIASDVTVTRLPASTSRDEALQLRALGGDVARQRYKLKRGRMLGSAPGEAMVAKGALDATGADVGDRLELTVAGRRLNVRIVGYYVDPSQRGRVAMVTRRTAQDAAIPLPAGLTQHALTTRPGVDPDALVRELEHDTAGLVEAQVMRDLWVDERNGVRPVIHGLLAVLLAVGLVNLLTTSMLTARERARDLAMLKTLGMTPNQLYAGTAAGAALLALVAVAVGIPVGLASFYALVVGLNPIDGPDIIAQPALASLAALPCAAVALACLAAIPPAHATARARVATALREE